MIGLDKNEIFFKNNDESVSGAILINDVDRYMDALASKYNQGSNASNEQLVCAVSYALNKIETTDSFSGKSTFTWRVAIGGSQTFSDNFFEKLNLLSNEDLIEFFNKTEKGWLLSKFFSNSKNFQPLKERIKSYLTDECEAGRTIKLGVDVVTYFCDLKESNDRDLRIFLESVINYNHQEFISIHKHGRMLKVFKGLVDAVAKNDECLKLLSENIDKIKFNDLSRYEEVNKGVSKMLLLATSFNDIVSAGKVTGLAGGNGRVI